MTEQMSWYEWCELQAQALMDRDAEGHLSYETKQKLLRIQSGEIEIMPEDWVRPLEDAT